jgi:hypothetical protein
MFKRVLKISVMSCTCLFLISCLYAQVNAEYKSSASAVQYGYSIKAIAEFGTGKGNLFIWRLGLSGGIGAFLGQNWIYPSAHTDLMFYQGGLGSKWPGYKRKQLDIELNLSYSVTFGAQNRMRAGHYLQPGRRNYPLYYFNNFNLPPLQNPFNYSASWGGNSIFHFRRAKGTRYQMVGMINLHADRFQVTYNNDGPPFFPPFGDKEDRLHTGSGFISMHGNDSWVINLIEIGFDKFTGYSKNGYRLGNKVGNGYIYHEDINEQYYNKSRVYINIANTAKNWGAAFNFYNVPWMDVQHKIHLNRFYTLHMVPYTWHQAVSVYGTCQYVKIGLQ